MTVTASSTGLQSNTSAVLSDEEVLQIERWRFWLQNREVALRVWRRHFSEADRNHFRHDADNPPIPLDVVGRWAHLRKINETHAVLGLVHRLRPELREEVRRLAQELGLPSLDEDAVEAAAESFPLVLSDEPFAVYWQGDKLPCDWEKHGALREYLWSLIRKAQDGEGLSYFDLVADAPGAPRKLLSERKYKLKKLKGFPSDLFKKIRAAMYSHFLDVKPDEIRIFRHHSDVHVEERRAGI